MSAVSIGAASVPCHLLCSFSCFGALALPVLPQAESQKPDAAASVTHLVNDAMPALIEMLSETKTE
jgi:hypothetical protein